MSRPSSVAATSQRSFGAASAISSSSELSANYALPNSEAGPSRSGNTSRRSSTSSASSRKGKERAHDEDVTDKDNSAQEVGDVSTNGVSKGVKESIHSVDDEEGSESEDEEDDEP